MQTLRQMWLSYKEIMDKIVKEQHTSIGNITEIDFERIYKKNLEIKKRKLHR